MQACYSIHKHTVTMATLHPLLYFSTLYTRTFSISILTSGQRSLMRDRIQWCGFFYGREVNVTPASQSHCSWLLQSRWCCYWFLLRTLQQWLTMFFNGPDKPEKSTFPLGDLDPI